MFGRKASKPPPIPVTDIRSKVISDTLKRNRVTLCLVQLNTFRCLEERAFQLGGEDNANRELTMIGAVKHWSEEFLPVTLVIRKEPRNAYMASEEEIRNIERSVGRMIINRHDRPLDLEAHDTPLKEWHLDVTIYDPDGELSGIVESAFSSAAASQISHVEVALDGEERDTASIIAKSELKGYSPPMLISSVRVWRQMTLLKAARWSWLWDAT